MEKQELISNGEKFIKSTYNGVSVIVDENGYYNASKICRDNKTKFMYWKKNDRTKKILQIYSKKLGKSIEMGGLHLHTTELPLILNKNICYNNETRGFYIHFKLVNDICNWCNLEYAIKINDIMDMIDEESKLRNITIENKMEEMRDVINSLKNEIEENKLIINDLQTQINNNCVRTKINTRYLRIYDITDYDEDEEKLNPFDRDCIWWVSANERKSLSDDLLLLEIQVISSMHARMDNKEYYNRATINHRRNTVRQDSKNNIYDYFINILKPKSIVIDRINN